MKRRHALPLSRLEEAELQRLVFRAMAVRDVDREAFLEAVREIESWHAETLPDRIRRFEDARSREQRR